MSKNKWTLDNIPSLHGKVIIVTGGNSGLGYESVRALSAAGAEVILASRSVEKGEEARDSIIKEFSGAKIKVMQLDLGDLSSVKEFAESFLSEYDRLDVLMNNACIMTTPYFLTKDGLEAQNGINHFGHFALTSYLLDTIRKTDGARIVNISSNAHKAGKMDFNDPLFKDGKGYSPMKSYGRSKLSNLLFTYELQRMFDSDGTNAIAVAAHPGFSRTNLIRYIDKKLIYKLFSPLLYPVSQSADMGALPQIRAAVDPAVKGGEYYGPAGFAQMKGYPVKVNSNAASHDREAARELWKLSEELVDSRIKINDL